MHVDKYANYCSYLLLPGMSLKLSYFSVNISFIFIYYINLNFRALSGSLLQQIVLYYIKYIYVMYLYILCVCNIYMY